MGSTESSQHADAPQQDEPSPCSTRRAACPYCSLTACLMLVSLLLMFISYLQQTIFCGSSALLRVQHSAKRKPSSSCNASALAEYRRNVPSRRTCTRSSFLN